MTTTPEQRAEWSRLAEAATAGPWETQIEDRSGAYVVGPSTNPHIPSPDVVATTRFSDRFAADDGANMSFIAASRTAIPALLADVETLTAERDKAGARAAELAGRWTTAMLGKNDERARAEAAEAKVAALEAEVARLNIGLTTARDEAVFMRSKAVNNARERNAAEAQIAAVCAETWARAEAIVRHWADCCNPVSGDVAAIDDLVNATIVALRQAATAQNGEAGR
jgi:hypothetical protein